MAADEVCCFSRFDVLLDNEASLNVFSNADLLTDVRKSERSIKVSGIQQGAGVSVDREGEFGELGTVYYSLSEHSVICFPSRLRGVYSVRPSEQLLHSSAERKREDLSLWKKVCRRQ